jgi:hypothetical protein
MNMTPRDRRCRRCGAATTGKLEAPSGPGAEVPRFCKPCGDDLGSTGREEYLRLSLLAA